ncbi:BRCT domain-containing protein [Cucumis melo var. makuwa]|uniref:BRCT domain-containing protein n=1 Tax=Cucumis melo var. makuwa TaxID=1194695 RepID=A0A5D3D1U4_CUCMM|nr:BRCT domain-containing protein [Cucumis melo var. makuwa]TYK18221.1 BRCT domain-containing protein [Cucumis melo var. makuwa]
MEIDYSCQPFSGVHFVLFGFNSVDEKQVRSKLIDGGGVDVGQYGPSCSHVIVDKNKIVYDDPVCVAARNDGKLLVTGLWVDHRYDSGLLADATSVLYRPLRELNGIPGAKSLIMCLTGYQRQDRDDVMTMVGLIGAQFSKPLVANKVTHLICYKFEGDKYELAKRLRTIKLVNHRWLEDSLREWMLLPESNYNMSGYDMEMLEAEAKDSEEESNSGITKQKLFARRNTKSPDNIKFGLHSTSEISNTVSASKTLDERTNFTDTKSMLTVPTTNTEFIPSGKYDKHDAVREPICQEVDVFSTPWDSMSFDMHASTSESLKQKVKNEVVTSPSNAARSPQLCATSYSRRTSLKSPLPLFSGERLERADASCKIATGEIKDTSSVDASLEKMEQVTYATFSGHEQNSSRGTDLFGKGDSNARLPLKSISDVSYDVPRSHSMSENTKSCTLNNPSADEKVLGLEMSRVSLNHDDSGKRCAKILQHSRASTDTSSPIKKPLTCDLPFSNSVRSPTEYVAEGSLKTPRTPFQISGKDLSPDKPNKLSHDCGISGDLVGKTKETDRQQNGVLAASESDSGTKATKTKSASPNSLNSSVIQNNDLHSKPRRIKMFAKKSLGSRPKLGSGSHRGSILLNKTTSLSDSVSSSCGNGENLFSSSPQDVSIGVKKVVETADKGGLSHKYEVMDEDDKTSDPENKEADFEHQMIDTENFMEVPHISDDDKVAKQISAGVKCNNSASMLEDTIPSGPQEMIERKAPISIGNAQLDELRLEDEKSKMNVGDRGPTEEKMLINSSKAKSKQGKVCKAPPRKKNGKTGKRPQLVAAGLNTEVHTIPDNISEKVNVPCEAMDEDDKTSDLENKEADFEQQMMDTEKLNEVPLISDDHKLAKEIASGVKCTNSTRVLDDTIPSGTLEEVLEPKATVSIENVQLDELSLEDEKSKLNVGDRGPTEEKMLKNSSKAKPKQGKVSKAPSRKKNEKTGKKPQLVAAGLNTEVHTIPDYKSEKENVPCDVGDKTSEHCDKITVESNTKQRKVTKKSSEISANSSMEIEEVLREVKPEPVCFILSGHRLERKEFQKVIKHLKGRVCRDSHQWSYQATHFIAPDPVRRTEKFFSAAASGRWILKSDYLTDSSQAGKLLNEEPYEWYKKGLTEDGAINLEAPRKWRLLREKTGHGAFYGMRIIIYGECIAPPLDTLKRAVKAGDGTILATSPPYTKFLKSGVDFAVIGPGMPRADTWVQEFLNNEIPCVAADYLVEYVCKPGYSLDKHVLYNTHAWAERSFSNLQSKAEEVAEDASSQDDCSDNDIACQECGSRDRGEVMLICGNEDGSSGCGIGMHTDCCYPPLLDIPEGDWFCSDCINSRNSNSSNKRKKGVSVKRK